MKKQKLKYLDLASGKPAQLQAQDTEKQKQFKSTLFSRGKKTDAFFTEDSRLYITPREQMLLRKGVELDRRTHKWDNLSSRIVNNFVYRQPSQASLLLKLLEQRYEKLNANIGEASQNLVGQFSLIRLWNLSIVGSILFGMVMMTFVYRYLGQGAAADQVRIPASQPVTEQMELSGASRVLGTETSKDAQEFAQQVKAIEKADSQEELEKQIREMVKGYPIENMVPYIAKQDRTVAAFLVGIAKKESGWGEHHPVLNGQDCFNYFGYRGKRQLMGSGGHTCFNSPQDAVQTVAKRISTLVEKHGKDTPEKMVDTWKCGTSCVGDADASKWISDVTMYFNKVNSAQNKAD